MKVLLSWSGARSLAVAELLNDWLPKVIQAIDPWISTGIDKGAPWLDELNTQLGTAVAGVLCLTTENKNAPWILFEAGALAKGLARRPVCTFLIDFAPKELDKPLSQFQATLPKIDDVRKLIFTLNKELPDDKRLKDGAVTDAFDAFWPKFENRFHEILKNTRAQPAAPKRSDSEILNEVLETVRSLERKVERPNVFGYARASGPVAIAEDMLASAIDRSRLARRAVLLRDPVTGEIGHNLAATIANQGEGDSAAPPAP